jgi:hypothetical protein
MTTSISATHGFTPPPPRPAFFGFLGADCELAEEDEEPVFFSALAVTDLATAEGSAASPSTGSLSSLVFLPLRCFSCFVATPAASLISLLEISYMYFL